MINTSFNHTLGYLEVFYFGEIDVTQLNNYGKKLSMDSTLPRSLKILTDATHANYLLNCKDIPLLLKNVKRQLKLYDVIYAAFVQHRPRETALSLLMEKEVDTNKYIHKVFSTREAAENWLSNL